jgi:hypothetical protein
MLKGETVVGAMTICRQEVRPFTDKQIFARNCFRSQYVGDSVCRQLSRNRGQRAAAPRPPGCERADLTETLEQQTATLDSLPRFMRFSRDASEESRSLLDQFIRLATAETGNKRAGS